MILQRCSKCNIEKPLEDFYPHKRYKNNYCLECKECIKIRGAQYRKTHKKEIAKKDHEYYEIHKKEIVWKRRKYYQTPNGKLMDQRKKHKRRARKKNTKITLTANQWGKILINQNNRCNICNKKFTKKRFATMDHIIPLSLGGDLTFENIQALCSSCNSSKNNKLDPQFIQVWLHEKR